MDLLTPDSLKDLSLVDLNEQLDHFFPQTGAEDGALMAYMLWLQQSLYMSDHSEHDEYTARISAWCKSLFARGYDVATVVASFHDFATEQASVDPSASRRLNLALREIEQVFPGERRIAQPLPSDRAPDYVGFDRISPGSPSDDWKPQDGDRRAGNTRATPSRDSMVEEIPIGNLSFEAKKSNKESRAQSQRERVNNCREKYKDKEPPEGYVCRVCKVAGHWVWHCPRGYQIHDYVPKKQASTGSKKPIKSSCSRHPAREGISTRKKIKTSSRGRSSSPSRARDDQRARRTEGEGVSRHHSRSRSPFPSSSSGSNRRERSPILRHRGGRSPRRLRYEDPMEFDMSDSNVSRGRACTPPVQAGRGRDNDVDDRKVHTSRRSLIHERDEPKSPAFDDGEIADSPDMMEIDAKDESPYTMPKTLARPAEQASRTSRLQDGLGFSDSHTNQPSSPCILTPEQIDWENYRGHLFNYAEQESYVGLPELSGYCLEDARDSMDIDETPEPEVKPISEPVMGTHHPLDRYSAAARLFMINGCYENPWINHAKRPSALDLWDKKEEVNMAVEAF